LKKYLFAIYFLFLISCECPPNIDTKQEIIPSEFSQICFINLNSEFPKIDIYSKNLLIKENLENTLNSETIYSKFPSGNNNLAIRSNNNIIYNSFVNVQKENFYSFFFYYSKNASRYKLLEDNIKDDNNAHLRIIHLSDIGKINIEITNEFPQPIEIYLNSEEFTNLIPFPSGLIHLKIVDYSNNELKFDKQIILQDKSITNIILTGDSLHLNVFDVKTIY